MTKEGAAETSRLKPGVEVRGLCPTTFCRAEDGGRIGELKEYGGTKGRRCAIGRLVAS
jgi:hypothetical protein